MYYSCTVPENQIVDSFDYSIELYIRCQDVLRTVKEVYFTEFFHENVENYVLANLLSNLFNDPKWELNFESEKQKLEIIAYELKRIIDSLEFNIFNYRYGLK